MRLMINNPKLLKKVIKKIKKIKKEDIEKAITEMNKEREEK